MNEKTLVVFRVFKDNGEVIALFPELPGDWSGDCCDSFMHVGQHSVADYDGLVRHTTRPATSQEFAALKKELEAAPYRYNLDVRRRAPSNSRRTRLAAI